jgi:hypothetical protein
LGLCKRSGCVVGAGGTGGVWDGHSIDCEPSGQVFMTQLSPRTGETMHAMSTDSISAR